MKIIIVSTGEEVMVSDEDYDFLIQFKGVFTVNSQYSMKE